MDTKEQKEFKSISKVNTITIERQTRYEMDDERWKKFKQLEERYRDDLVAQGKSRWFMYRKITPKHADRD
jgi:hypothetical protein